MTPGSRHERASDHDCKRPAARRCAWRDCGRVRARVTGSRARRGEQQRARALLDAWTARRRDTRSGTKPHPAGPTPAGPALDGPSVVGCKPRSRGARRRFNGAVNADYNAVLSTALQRVLLVTGAYLAVAMLSGVFAAVVTVATLRVAGFHELDPAGTAWRIGAAVLAWELLNRLLWAAWHWRGSAGLGVFLRTGRSAQRRERGGWFRVLWWTVDAVAVAAAVVGILLLRFPDEPSAWWAAAEILVVIKGLQAAIFWSLVAVNKAFDRGRERLERAQPLSNPKLVPVEDILSRPDITEQHPYKPRHGAD